jgi:hypothetical protein
MGSYTDNLRVQEGTMKDFSVRWFKITTAAVMFYAVSAVSVEVGAQRSAVAAEASSEALTPPSPPRHRLKNITNVADLAEDLKEVVVYLEKGQVYFKTYQTGSHTVSENADFLNFLETYERELALAKKEAKTLQAWIETKGSLDSVLK